MTKPQSLRLFLRIAPELSLNDFNPINQVHWADELGISQPSLGKALETLVAEEILVEGPKEGTSKTFKINPRYPGIHFLFNRTR